MEKQEYSQLDLFSKAGESEGAGQRLSGTFLSYIRTYERLVLMLIGLVVTGVVCFCVGVEKGKHLALSRFNSSLDIAYNAKSRTPRAGMGAVQVPPRAAAVANTLSPRVSPSQMTLVPTAKQPVKTVPVAPSRQITVARAAPQAMAGVYTIQVGSYKGTAAVQQEVSILKKQGLLPVVKSSGEYTVLCVGNFPDQATARSILTQLKRKYRDCYIRRL